MYATPLAKSTNAFAHHVINNTLSFISCLIDLVHPSIVAVFLLCTVAGFFRARASKQEFLPLDFCEPAALILLALFSILAVFSLSPYAPFFRYLALLIPLGAIVSAWMLSYIWKFSKPGAVILALFALLMFDLHKHIYEITHDFDGPIEGIVKFPDKNASKSDIVAMTYGDLSVKFYTGLKVVAGERAGELDMIPRAKWVIIRKYTVYRNDEKARQEILRRINLKDYDRITIDYPDTCFENRENWRLRYFATQKDEDRVVILRRREG